MNILLKNALKNIFGKPLRTILVIFSIFVCSMAAMLCFDLSGAIGEALMNDVRSVSDADYELILRPGYSIDMPEDFPEHTALAVYLYGEAAQPSGRPLSHARPPVPFRFPPARRAPAGGAY